MDRNEIEAELNEVERDLADIARRAHIAASNLRAVAGADINADARLPLAIYAQDIERIEFNAKLAHTALAKTRAVYIGAKPAPVAAEEGGKE